MEELIARLIGIRNDWHRLPHDQIIRDLAEFRDDLSQFIRTLRNEEKKEGNK